MDSTVLYERLMRRLIMIAGARSRRATFRHGTVHWLDVAGNGSLPPVVLLHGFSASGPTQFAAMARLLRPHVRRVIVPDLPGHGSSSVPAALTGDVLGEGMFAALDAALHEESPAIVFASSMSGGLAVRYSARYPNRVAGLMLCSPGGAPPTAEELEEIVGIFRISNHREALSFVDRMFSEPHWMRQAYALAVRQQFQRPQFRALLERVSEERFLEPSELQSLSMPIHLIWGLADRILPARHLAYFREHLPAHAEIETPTSFGHVPFLRRADELALRLLWFARRVSLGVESGETSSAA